MGKVKVPGWIPVHRNHLPDDVSNPSDEEATDYTTPSEQMAHALWRHLSERLGQEAFTLEDAAVFLIALISNILYILFVGAALLTLPRRIAIALVLSTCTVGPAIVLSVLTASGGALAALAFAVGAHPTTSAIALCVLCLPATSSSTWVEVIGAVGRTHFGTACCLPQLQALLLRFCSWAACARRRLGQCPALVRDLWAELRRGRVTSTRNAAPPASEVGLPPHDLHEPGAWESQPDSFRGPSKSSTALGAAGLQDLHDAIEKLSPPQLARRPALCTPPRHPWPSALRRTGPSAKPRTDHLLAMPPPPGRRWHAA